MPLIPGDITDLEEQGFRVTAAGVLIRYTGEASDVTIPASVTSIGFGAFQGRDSLTSVVIPDGVTSIGFNAFKKCNRLTSVVIPEGVTSIEQGAFDGCTSLTSLVLPDSLASIGGCAFYGCASLTSLMPSDGVTSFGEYAFYGCGGLTSLRVPESEREIEEHAFQGCVDTVFICDHVDRINGGNTAWIPGGALVMDSHGKAISNTDIKPTPDLPKGFADWSYNLRCHFIALWAMPDQDQKLAYCRVHDLSMGCILQLSPDTYRSLVSKHADPQPYDRALIGHLDVDSVCRLMLALRQSADRDESRLEGGVVFALHQWVSRDRISLRISSTTVRSFLYLMNTLFPEAQAKGVDLGQYRPCMLGSECYQAYCATVLFGPVASRLNVLEVSAEERALEQAPHERVPLTSAGPLTSSH